MKNFFIRELAGLVAAAITWVFMWALDLGNGTILILDRDISIRIIVALAIGLVVSLSVSAVVKRKARAEE
ncbi:MAG: hypothetical protein FWD05_07010 [Oscillospiraceae bacterium]|nr:hypothetical protein [Oscillospiraceae bacterium]